MSVTAAKSGIVRQMTCAQWANLSPSSGWVLVTSNCDQEYTQKTASPYASSGTAPSAPSGIITATITAPDGTVAIPAGRLLQHIVVQAETGARTISVGTTDGGGEIVDAENITSDRAFEISQTKFFASAGLLYFTVSADADVLIYTR